MSIRLSVLNSETARRTRDLYTRVNHISMSSAEPAACKNSESSKAREERQLKYKGNNNA